MQSLQQYVYLLTCLGLISLTFNYINNKERPFASTEKLVDINFNQLPNSFFKELAKLNFGYAHRLFSLMKAKKAKIKRLGNAVLLIDEYVNYACLTGESLPKDVIHKIAIFCKKNNLTVFCDPKYNPYFADLIPSKDIECILDSKEVFVCNKTYNIEPNLGLNGGIGNVMLEPKVVRMSKAEFDQSVQKRYMAYLYGANGLSTEMECYALKLGEHQVAEIFVLMGEKSDWGMLGGSSFSDNRNAEIYIYVSRKDFYSRGYGTAISKFVINDFKKRYPKCKLYWTCNQLNLRSIKLAKKLELEKVGTLNRITYKTREFSGLLFDI